MLISVLASVVLIELVSLDAGEAFGLLDVVIETVGILGNAKVLAVEGESLITADADSVFVCVAIADLAGGLFGELEGVFALIAAIIVVRRAAVDAALSVAEGKGRLTRAAVTAVIVDTSRSSLHASVGLFAEVVAACALYAGSIGVHLLAELVF